MSFSETDPMNSGYQILGSIRQLSADEEARRLAFVRERAQRDEATLLKEAEARGREEGVALGEVKGEAKLLKRLISNVTYKNSSAANFPAITPPNCPFALTLFSIQSIEKQQ